MTKDIEGRRCIKRSDKRLGFNESIIEGNFGKITYKKYCYSAKLS